MANICPHGVELPNPDPTKDVADGYQLPSQDGCAVECAECGHRCHRHVGQACDAGGSNHCLHPDGCGDSVHGKKTCMMWVEPEA